MQSQQERFVNALSARAVGVRFVFEPDPYMRGKNQKEPFDLAWASNNCLVLMNMTAGKKSRDQMKRHNMDRLIGWLRAWSAERRLRGRNDFHEFDIAPHDYKYVVLVSVVDGPNATAEYHREVVLTNATARAHNVVLAGTVPEKALVAIAESGGSTRDLVSYLNLLRIQGRALREDEAVATVHALHRSAFTAATEATPGYNIDPTVLTSIIHTIVGTRAAPTSPMPPAAPPDTQMGDVFEELNDLDWQEMLILLRTATAAVSTVAAVQPGTYGPLVIGGEVSVGPYDFMLCVVNSLTTNLGSTFPLTDAWRQRSQARPPYPPIQLFLYLDFFWETGWVGSMLSAYPRTGISATEHALAQAAADQVLGR